MIVVMIPNPLTKIPATWPIEILLPLRTSAKVTPTFTVELLRTLTLFSALLTLIGPVIAPWLPSNHSAPTPNCQFGSRLPSRIRVLLEMVVARDDPLDQRPPLRSPLDV